MQPDTPNQPHLTGIFEAIQASDEQALKTLYQQEYPKVQRYVLENNGTPEQARDVFQEAFIAVWRNIQLDRFKPQSETALAGYLYQVAKNKWIDFLRSGYYKKTVHASDTIGDLDLPDIPPQEEHEYIGEVKKGFMQLGENCKEVLRRFYYKNEAIRTIAEAMNWTEATARNNKYRCIERLREMLKRK